MVSRASRSNGDTEKPCAQYVRFTEEQNKRLHRARQYRGQTVQTLVHAATMKAIVEAEAEMAKDAQERAQREAAKPKAKAPGGLGIRERLTPAPVVNEPAPPAPPLAPQITINVPAAAMVAAPNTDRIAALAQFVVSGGPSYQRAARLREACMGLAKGAANAAEATRLAEQLDAAIASIKPKGALESALGRVQSRMKRR